MLNWIVENITVFDSVTVYLCLTELFEIEPYMYKNGFSIK